ncbi:hypothetical protein K6119_00450 [Paracrocinitomix mangrovi]|uniref:hypothetical protein n=1 Tax=Paracrocinitomix mangrovi TaxID=2862509 RepID=UPI001C8D0F71|nr:hypothetical protein [Paracrocinitomix mangrovi]UKN01984.1 hypothetical protein K6119_00450 [Paracrocinitomix mangrovi]
MNIFLSEHIEVIELENLEKFKEEMKSRVGKRDLADLSRNKSFYGTINKKGFLIEKNELVKNFGNPVLKGTYTGNKVRLELVVPKRMFGMLLVWILMVPIGFMASDMDNKIQIIPMITIIVFVFWYAIGLLLYNLGLNAALNGMRQIKELADNC